ncbi:hypothetical protein [Streptomyces azureus]|uniref:Uncharacterized protein n=1 Tax=Streptomyces azureus TaxID=146537 RepID=A0A0K8PW89_STRAJ|nr:hypothetical protein [Streptomyces azureus]GAP51719.1 uncharacterized protein SAZU_6592 [Streptomyces azureus]
MTSTEAAAIALQDHAALWSTGEIRASDVVNAACDALVAGLDTPGLRILAACTRAEADYDVPELLPKHSTNSASPSTRSPAMPAERTPPERSHAACLLAS